MTQLFLLKLLLPNGMNYLLLKHRKTFCPSKNELTKSRFFDIIELSTNERKNEMTIQEKVELVKNLIRQHGNKFLAVDFRKKDGSLRHMLCHRSKVLESNVKGTNAEATEARKATLKSRNMICVEELVKPAVAGHQWRTVNCETVEKISCNGQEYVFD